MIEEKKTIYSNNANGYTGGYLYNERKTGYSKKAKIGPFEKTHARVEKTQSLGKNGGCEIS